MSIDNQINEVRRLDNGGESERAFSLVKKLISESPEESRLWSLQGALYAKNRHYEEAVKSLSAAIALSPEGIFYFHRGRYNSTLDNLSEAIEDFSNALIRDTYNDITFTQELYFHRADAFIRLGKREEALSDISRIPDDYKTWTSKLSTKADLLADCNNL